MVGRDPVGGRGVVVVASFGRGTRLGELTPPQIYDFTIPPSFFVNHHPSRMQSSYNNGIINNG